MGSVHYIAISLIPAAIAAVCAAAAAATYSLTPGRIHSLITQSEPNADSRALLRYRDDGHAIRSRWFVARVLGIVLTTTLFQKWLPASDWRAIIAICFATLVLYGVPAEILRGISERHAARFSPKLIRLLRPVEWLVMPIAMPLYWLERAFAEQAQRSTPVDPDAETEMELMVKENEDSGSLDRDQSEMIRNVLEFSDLTAGDVMVPRTRVTTLPIGSTVDSILKIVIEKGHSRYPVVALGSENIVGVLHVKDLMKFVREHPAAQPDLEQLARKPVAFVPEGQACSSVLAEMRLHRHHLAIVIDEFGGMSGIVTLEDLIEEIVGDIQDEHDLDEAPIADLGGGRMMVSASVPIGDLSRYLNIDFEDGDYHSLGGFIIDRLGYLPETGAQVHEFGLDFIVREADERHVVKVEIVREEAQPDSVAATQNQDQSAA